MTKAAEIVAPNVTHCAPSAVSRLDELGKKYGLAEQDWRKPRPWYEGGN